MIITTGNLSLDSALNLWLASGPDRDCAQIPEDDCVICVLITPRVCYRATSKLSWEDAVRNALTIALHAERRPVDPLPGAASLAALQAFALSKGIRCT